MQSAKISVLQTADPVLKYIQHFNKLMTAYPCVAAAALVVKVMTWNFYRMP